MWEAMNGNSNILKVRFTHPFWEIVPSVFILFLAYWRLIMLIQSVMFCACWWRIQSLAFNPELKPMATKYWQQKYSLMKVCWSQKAFVRIKRNSFFWDLTVIPQSFMGTWFTRTTMRQSKADERRLSTWLDKIKTARFWQKGVANGSLMPCMSGKRWHQRLIYGTRRRCTSPSRRIHCTIHSTWLLQHCFATQNFFYFFRRTVDSGSQLI